MGPSPTPKTARRRAATSFSRIRTGIYLGRPRKLGGDYLDVDVNIAARLTEAAKPGEVLSPIASRACGSLTSAASSGERSG